MAAAFSVGVIGAGAILDFHLEALRLLPEFRISAVADTDGARQAESAARLDCQGFASHRALLGEKPDVVLVLLPHSLHCPVALDALRAGCHVVVEKPMALDVRECREMIGEAARLRRFLVVADSASSTPGALRTGARFRDGALGRFLAGSVINARFYFEDRRPSWFLDPGRSGGGMFANLGVHRLALARACLPGLGPAAVSATVGELSSRPVEACTSALVRYHGGGAMHYEEIGYVPRPAWLAAGTHLVFEKGIVGWDDQSWRVQSTEGCTEETLPARPVLYAPLYEQLRSSLRGDGPPVSAEGNALDVAVAQAAYASAREGREISLDDPQWRVTDR